MAGFCRNCGSPMGDAQAFCSKCGTQIPRPAQPSAGTAAPPAAPAQSVVAAPAKGSPLIKILLVVVGVFAVFAAIGIAGMIYVGHRIHQKAEEMGLSSSSRHVSTIGGLDACSLLSKDDVSGVIGMEVVRAEKDPGGSPGCAYSVQGDAADLTAKHLSQMTKQMSQDNKQPMSKADQQTIENMSKQFFHGAQAAQGGGPGDHPVETPVFSFVVDDNAAQFQMKLNKGIFARMGPLATTTIPDLGDEAFDISGAILMFRKGDKLVRVMYTTCPCGRDDIVPLAKKIASGL